MLQVQAISKAFGIETVLENISFGINAGERVALVGANGSGKSTLLRIIVGEIEAASGRVHITPGMRIGYLPQGLAPEPGETLGEVAFGGLESWRSASGELERLAEAMADDPAAMEVYDDMLTHFESLGGYGVEYRVGEVLSNLGLGDISLDTLADTLSGGQQTRLMLARLLITEPDMLILDEPSNHLDLTALTWLERFIRGYDGAVLIVSHDRAFLDRTVERIIELDELTHRARVYTGNYSDYQQSKAHARTRQEATYRTQQADIAKMEGDIHRTKHHALSVELTTTPRQPGVRRYAKKVAKKAASRQKKLDRYLESDERVEKPDQRWGVKLDFANTERGGQMPLRLEGVGHRYGGGDWLFRNVDQVVGHGERIVLMGDNGAGKSTLMEIIMGRLTPAEGRVHTGTVKPGYMPQKQDSLDAGATPFSVIQAATEISETETRNFLHTFLFAGDDVFVPVESLSYGERSRLLLARIVIGGANLLLLDEPFNHLDVGGREHFEAALEAFPGAVIVVTHDRAFIDRYATAIWSMGGGEFRGYLDREEMSRVAVIL